MAASPGSHIPRSGSTLAVVLAQVVETVAAEAARHHEDLNLGPAALGRFRDLVEVGAIGVGVQVGVVPPLALDEELGLRERVEVNRHRLRPVVGQDDDRNVLAFRQFDPIEQRVGVANEEQAGGVERLPGLDEHWILRGVDREKLDLLRTRICAKSPALLVPYSVKVLRNSIHETI